MGMPPRRTESSTYPTIQQLAHFSVETSTAEALSFVADDLIEDLVATIDEAQAALELVTDLFVHMAGCADCMTNGRSWCPSAGSRIETIRGHDAFVTLADTVAARP